MTPRCAQKMYRDWGERSCPRKGVVEEGGKWWCWQHAPSAVAARRGASDRRYKAESALSDARYARTMAEAEVLVAVRAREAVTETTRAKLLAADAAVEAARKALS